MLSLPRALLALVAGALVIGGCASLVDGPPPAAAPAATSPGADDLAPGWDESPDTPEPTPDAALDASQLADILRLPASAPATNKSCRRDDVAVSLTFMDAAMGHRFGVLAVENLSGEPCAVAGYPGLGVRGAWGSTFLLDVEHRDPLEPAPDSGPVTLAAGERAQANVEWTGELAGAASEPVSLLVVQLAASQDALGNAVSMDGPPGEPNTGIDIGMFTTVRVGPFAPALDVPNASDSQGA